MLTEEQVMQRIKSAPWFREAVDATAERLRLRKDDGGDARAILLEEMAATYATGYWTARDAYRAGSTEGR